MNSKFRRKSTSINDTRIAGLYDLEHTIGKGHFAVVKLAKHVFTGEKVAVKVIDKTKMQDETRKYMMQEVRCMKLVQHPNIVRLYEVIDTQTKLFLILELGDYDMYDYIMKNPEKGCKETDAQTYFSQIIKAIDYCHTLHVVHRDLKPENVVFFEKIGMVKLTDFGFSNLYTPGQQLNTSCGSLAYSAPEILLGDAYDPVMVDVWSLGVILYMLVCGRLPFQEANESETLTKILDCRFSLPDYLSPPCKQLISRMLIRDPNKRATLSEIIQSQWVVAGDRGHAEVLPLIVKDHLPESAHSTIIEQMIAGGIGAEEEILNAIENDDYSYITATYYLLAERVLASYREEQANRLICEASTPCDDKEIFDRYGRFWPYESFSCENNFSSSAPNHSSGFQARSRSNSWRGASSKRAFTILKEESEEELCSYLRSSSRQSSRFFKEPVPPPVRREHSQPSRLTMGSRASSSDSFAAPCPILEVTDDKENAEFETIDELCPSSPPSCLLSIPDGYGVEHRTFNYLSGFSFDELSPIREHGSAASFSQSFFDEPQEDDVPLEALERKPRFTIDSISSQSSNGPKFDQLEHSPIRRPLKLLDSLELPEWEPVVKPGKIPRTPSAPMTFASIVKKRLRRAPLLRRNSSPSVSMFGGLHSSRDRISPQAIQELLEFSRTSGIRRAASPDSRFSSRSPSPPTSSGPFSGIVSRLKSSMITSHSASGMRKLSSSPHLLGICEESEDLTDSNASPFYASTSKSGFHKSGASSSKGHLTRNNRSASTGFSSSASARLQKMPTIVNNDVFDNPGASTSSNSISSFPTYGSTRVVRPRQAVVSPDMARRYEQHQRFVARSRKSASCSSSETSDDDSNERKWSLIGTKYCKRNSDDPKPDEDPPRGGTGSGNAHGSYSVKMTIPENETTNGNGEQETSTNADDSNHKSNKISDSGEFLDTNSVYGRHSYASGMGLQPILEHPPDALLYDKATLIRCRMFNKSETAREALHEWVRESKDFNNDKIEEFDSCRDKFIHGSSPKSCCMKRASASSITEPPFYRNLTRSLSLESLHRNNYGTLSGSLRSLKDSRSDSICLDLSDKEDYQSQLDSSSPITNDSGCSSDDDDQCPIKVSFDSQKTSSAFSRRPKIGFQEDVPYKLCQFVV